VTLTSDVGAAYSAQMKAVLLRSLETGQVVDLTHDLPAHGVAEASFVLRTMARGFPRGTVHLVVVDPGVGGRRAPIAIHCRDGSVLIGPDNGVLYPLAQELGIEGSYRIRPEPGAEPRRVGTTFDGRDVFAPAAARVARGLSPSRLGPPLAPKAYHLPAPRRAPHGARGAVLHVDHFGNLITNVPSSWVPSSARSLVVSLGRGSRRRLPRATSYEALGAGHLGVLGSSFGTLEVAVALARADRRLGITVGNPVGFAWPRASAGAGDGK
jgi:S-adenosyl-L-methionine hydrolase (adenosine-forming)